MLASRFIDMLKRIVETRGGKADNWLYKRHPIVSSFSNDSFEVDVLLTMQWLSYCAGNFLSEAALIKNDEHIYMVERDVLTRAQLEENRQYHASHGLIEATNEQCDLMMFCALRSLFVNEKSFLNTPVDYRTRIQVLEQGVVVLNFIKMEYSCLQSPNRNALYKEFVSPKHEQSQGISGHQVEMDYEQNQSTSVR